MREKLTKFELAAELGTNPLVCNFGGGGGGGTQKTVQKSEPWEGQKPFLSDVYSQAQSLYRQSGPRYYPYSTVAPYDDYRKLADELTVNAATPAALGMMNQGRYGLTTMLGATDVLSNPFFHSALNASLSPVVNTYQREILPGITSTAEEIGAYSNTRLPLVRAQAAQDALQSMLNTAAQFGSTAYGQGLQATGQAAGLIPQYMQAAFMPYDIIGKIGATRQAQTQAEINDAVKRFEYYEHLPYAKLAEYANTIGDTSPGGTTFTKTKGGGDNTGLATMLMMLPFIL